MNRFPAYDVTMSETHHIHKLDAPSGTAITLAEGILDNLDRKERWVKGTLQAPDGTISGSTDCAANELPVSSIREGEVPVFWPCGVTPQAAVMNSRPSFAITHAPGHMFITDILNSESNDYLEAQKNK